MIFELIVVRNARNSQMHKFMPCRTNMPKNWVFLSELFPVYIRSLLYLLQVTVKDLEHVIEKLEKEKAELNSALNAKKANPSSLK